MRASRQRRSFRYHPQCTQFFHGNRRKRLAGLNFFYYQTCELLRILPACKTPVTLYAGDLRLMNTQSFILIDIIAIPAIWEREYNYMQRIVNLPEPELLLTMTDYTR